MESAFKPMSSNLDNNSFVYGSIRVIKLFYLKPFFFNPNHILHNYLSHYQQDAFKDYKITVGTNKTEHFALTKCDSIHTFSGFDVVYYYTDA